MDTGPRGVSSKTKVKNKAPALVQITAEQLLREAKERELEVVPPPPKQKISDQDELDDYRLRKRKFFEDNIRKNRMTVSNWLKYAAWEESQQEIRRARSVFERALDVFGSRNITIWLKYIEMEMKNGKVNHARNLFDRAVTILPRVNQFWYKYTLFEERLENMPGCRHVFERWMQWWPDEQAWQTYINFELRYREIDRAREIYSQFVMLHPDMKNWMKFAKFEERHSGPCNARKVYELAIEFFGDANADEKLFVAFAKFEESQHEYERVRVIYQHALSKLPNSTELFEQFTIFEKKHGAQKDIERLISTKRKNQYEDAIKKDPHDYDAWFDLIKLAEDEMELEEIRDIYERAVAVKPVEKHKDAWRRYIYLWIYYAIFEELCANDLEKAREVYRLCLDETIPHKRFTFAKVWLMAAKFEIRQLNIPKARKILGRAIGKCPKSKLFKEYIEIEIQLRQFDNCRRLYEKFIEFTPNDSSVWVSYAELEAILGENDRARGIYEIAIDKELDMPENVWKAYIDFETEQAEDGDYTKVIELYERLLGETRHVKVWESYARFFEDTQQLDKARAIYARANKELVHESAPTRLLLLESWQDFENRIGSVEQQRVVNRLMPVRVRKRRKLGDDDLWEDYYEYEFPSAEKEKTSLMDRVKNWKAQQKLKQEKEGNQSDEAMSDN
ncbi:Crooked neck-like protein 1, partial [Fragariocoptes setiger]